MFSLAHSFRWSDFILPSTLQLNFQLRLLLEPIRSKKIRERVELGLQEALVNAVVHGNLNDPQKALRVRRIVTPKWVVWQIQDEGIGFDKSKGVFCLPTNLQDENGRGLFLINKCFDDVRWSKKGNRLQLACRKENQLMRRTARIFDFLSNPKK